jgi:hypothetical protein
MKKYLTLIFLLSFVSCDLVFHEEDNEYIVVDKPQEKIDLLNGVYLQLSKMYDGNYFSLFTRGDDVNVYVNYSYDIRGSAPVDYMGTVACSSSGGSINFEDISGTLYKNLYKGIVTINSLMAQLTVDEDSLLMGELYFLRGYSYYQLARFFGQPPLIFDTDVSYVVPKPSYEQVYQAIEEDLLNAMDLLPDTYTAARVPGETPHKGTVKALLAEVYLSWAGFPLNDRAKYAESAKYAKEVIEQSEYYNLGLLDDFANLWSKKYRHNKECVLGLLFSDSKNGIYPVGIHLMIDNYRIPSGSYKPKFKFFKTYPQSYRRAITMMAGRYDYNSIQTQDSVIQSLKFIPVDPLINPCDYIESTCFMKWVDMNSLENEDYFYGVYASGLTLYLLRYGQTLLTYAEASARSGNLDGSAYEAVNKIRRRAHKVDLNTASTFDLPMSLTSEQFIDSVVWERAWELCCEPGGRWFDIVRLDMKNKLPDLVYNNDVKNTIPADLLSDDWYFFQVPKDDQWLNSNLKP